MPGIDRGLEPLRKWQIESGWMAAFLNRFFFCGVVPGVFFLSIRSIRPQMPIATAFAQGVWGGVSGIILDKWRWMCVADAAQCLVPSAKHRTREIKL